MQDLKKIDDSKKFYDERYDNGYMEKWPAEKRSRVYEIVKSLKLADEGEALDFGCGNGVFTEVLKQALPGWKIYGCDLSETAIRNAKAKIKDCLFFLNDDITHKDKKFDFIFSHHVLEHVFDIEEVARQIVERAKDRATMLHILPCGNEGSFEWRVCNSRKDGINKEMENRFFYEDKGHIRRMTTESCGLLFEKFGFSLKQAFYSNQHDGALNLITRYHPISIFKIFNPLKGKNIKSMLYLSLLLVKFMSISAVRLPYLIYQKYNNVPVKIIFYIPSRISKCIGNYLVYKSEQEWEKLKTEKNGSEMYLCFYK